MAANNVDRRGNQPKPNVCYFDFTPPLIHNILLSRYPIIKRRIAWLLGKWVSEECTSPANDLVWKILIHLLSDADAVVHFTAAFALRECLDVCGSVSYPT